MVRRTWALKGQRPISHHYPRYKWLYTYGFVHPQTGNSYLFILPRVNTTIEIKILLTHHITPRDVGNFYGLRTWVEYGLKQSKNELGWADFRLTHYSQIDKW